MSDRTDGFRPAMVRDTTVSLPVSVAYLTAARDILDGTWTDEQVGAQIRALAPDVPSDGPRFCLAEIEAFVSAHGYEVREMRESIRTQRNAFLRPI